MSANGSNIKLNFFPEILDYMKKFVNTYNIINCLINRV